MKALSQNIGSLITMAGTNQAKLPAKTLSDLSQVYEELITTHGNPRPTKIGFVYTPPYGSDWTSGKDKRGSGGGKSESVVVGSGSGFVVHPHVILTNRHVIEHASGLLVLDPKNSKAEPLAAELIAIADGKDLALVRCNKLDAPPVRLVDKLPPRGTDIMVLGYPLGPSFGTALKSTRGSMVAMPDAHGRQHVPVRRADQPRQQRRTAVRQVGPRRGGRAGRDRRRGRHLRRGDPDCRRDSLRPQARARPGRQPLAEAKELDWPAVDALVSPSTVLILKKENLQRHGRGGWEAVKAVCCATRALAKPPLPQGEGRGEGEVGRACFVKRLNSISAPRILGSMRGDSRRRWTSVCRRASHRGR